MGQEGIGLHQQDDQAATPAQFEPVDGADGARPRAIQLTGEGGEIVPADETGGRLAP